MILMIFLPVVYLGQGLNPVTWETSYEEISDSTGDLVFTAKIEDKWHIYSQKQGNDGPIPTSFTLIMTPDFKLIGEVQEPKPENVYTEVFQSNVLMFSKQVVFRQKIHRHNKKQFFVNGELEYMACNDLSCLPPKTLKINIKVGAHIHEAKPKAQQK